jgi:sRNA-binding regulator protein Hfq
MSPAFCAHVTRHDVFAQLFVHWVSVPGQVVSALHVLSCVQQLCLKHAVQGSSPATAGQALAMPVPVIVAFTQVEQLVLKHVLRAVAD